MRSHRSARRSSTCRRYARRRSGFFRAEAPALLEPLIATGNWRRCRRSRPMASESADRRDLHPSISGARIFGTPSTLRRFVQRQRRRSDSRLSHRVPIRPLRVLRLRSARARASPWESNAGWSRDSSRSNTTTRIGRVHRPGIERPRLGRGPDRPVVVAGVRSHQQRGPRRAAGRPAELGRRLAMALRPGGLSLDEPIRHLRRHHSGHAGRSLRRTGGDRRAWGVLEDAQCDRAEGESVLPTRSRRVHLARDSSRSRWAIAVIAIVAQSRTPATPSHSAGPCMPGKDRAHSADSARRRSTSMLSTHSQCRGLRQAGIDPAD